MASNTIILDGLYPAVDAAQEAANIAELGYPPPEAFARANSFLNPLGEQPARGWFLFTRHVVNTINLNALHTIALADNAGRSVTLRSLVVASEPRAVTPGQPDDTTAAFLVEFADQRHQLAAPTLGMSVNAGFNIRAPAWGGAYYETSLNSGSAWTWQGMVTTLWTYMSQLGGSYTLPFTPDGTPEGWHFPGVSAWTALNQVLRRLGCAVKYDPTAASNQYSIARVGAADAATTLALANAASREIFDAEFQAIVRGKLPGKVRVFFHRQWSDYGVEQTTPRIAADQWLSSSNTLVDVSSTVAGTDSNTIHPLWDDLPALAGADGTISNQTALNTRAAERAADFYRVAQTGGDRLHRIYTGILTLQPGSIVKGVAWRQDMGGIGGEDSIGGFVSEVVRHPFRAFRVGDTGEWCCEDEGSTPNQPSFFGPQWPIYPHLLQILRVADKDADSSGRFDSYVQQFDSSTLAYTDKERVWAYEINGLRALPLGKYVARLTGYSNGRPLYQLSHDCCCEYTPVTVSTATSYSLSKYGPQTVVFATTSGTVTATLPASSTIPAGVCWYAVVCNYGTKVVNITRASSDTINGATVLAIAPGQTVRVFWDGGTAFYAETGRHVRPTKEITGDYTVTADDFAYNLVCNVTSAAITVTIPVFFSGFNITIANGWASTKKVTLSTTSASFDTVNGAVLAPRQSMDLFSNGSGYSAARGVHGRPSREITDNYTVSVEDWGYLLLFNISSDKTVTLPVFPSGFYVDIGNGWGSTGKLTLSTTSGAGDTVNGAVLAPRQGMGLFSNGSGYAAQRGVHGQPVKTVSSTTYTLLIEDFGYEIAFTASADISLTLPSFPSGYYATILNAIGTEKLITYTGPGYVPYGQSTTLRTSGSGNWSNAPGLTLSGLDIKSNTDVTASLNNVNRLMSLEATDANHTVTFPSTTNNRAFGAFYSAKHGNTKFIDFTIPGGCSWVSGVAPSLASASSVLVTSDGASNFEWFMGAYLADIILIGTGTVPGATVTLDATSHRSIFEGRGANNITVTMPTAFPGSLWWHETNTRADGFKWQKLVNQAGTQTYMLAADRGATFVTNGAGDFTAVPGDFGITGIRYTGDATLTYAHSGFAHWWEITADKTLTLDASCALAGQAFCIPVANAPTSTHAKKLNISVTTTLHGLPGNYLLPCQGGWIMSCDDGDFVFIPGYSCCCNILTTKGDLYTYTTTEARLPVGSDGYTLQATSAAATGLSWVSPASSGFVVSISVPAYMTSSVTAGVATLAFAAQAANTFFAGPTSGGALAPAFRVIVAADLGTGAVGAGARYLADDMTWKSASTAGPAAVMISLFHLFY